MKYAKIEIRRNTANTYAVSALDDDGKTMFHMIVNSWEELVALIGFAGCGL